MMTDLKSLVQGYRDMIVQFRRDLHRIPELGFDVAKTADYVGKQLDRLGLDVTVGIAGNGLVGLLNAEKDGRTLLVRSDMDALPIQEETGLDFASVHPGAMHACGHDGHMAMVLGAAHVLHALRSDIGGRIKFLFQPAEEGPGGAKPMIEQGVMDNPKVDYAIGAHLWPALQEGTIGVKSGPVMAAMDWFEIKIVGKGGHGAMPHLCVDPVDTAVQVINGLQRIVSRQMNPLNPTVVTVGSFHAGTTFNIIPDTAELKGTTRTFDRDIWLSWAERIEKVVKGICDAAGADYELRYHQGYPPTVNNDEMAVLAARCAARVVGEKNVLEPEATMGGEDMAFFLEQSEGCFLFLGTGREGGAPLHNSRFDFNESVLLHGVEIYCRMALELLS